MAHIGMKYPVAAVMKEDETYEAGFVVGKAINFTGTANSSDVVLHADDGAAESDRSLQNLSTSLNVDDISLKVQADLLGHTYTPAGGEGASATPEKLEVKDTDNAPYVGMGFYKRRKKNGVISYTAIWLYKVQNAPKTEEAVTKGETVEFQTDTIEGTAYPRSDGKVYDKVLFVGATAEASAKAWLNTQAGIANA